MEEYSLGDKITVIFKSGNIVKLDKEIRIKDDKTFYVHTWTVDDWNSGWFGFETLEECVDDCLTKLAIKNL